VVSHTFLNQQAVMPKPDFSKDGCERILQAACELFAEQPFDAVSMNAIATRAGVSKANVFHHFNSKGALYIAALQEVCQDTTALIDELSQSGAGTLSERLHRFARGHLSNILGQAGAARLILRDLLENGQQRGKDLAEQVFGQSFAKLVEILRDGQRKGELRSDFDPAMAALLLLAADVFFFQARDVFRHYPDVKFADHPERFSRMLVDMLLQGIAAQDSNS
jgi:TetR/AcrR family transcriptional regulator